MLFQRVARRRGHKDTFEVSSDPLGVSLEGLHSQNGFQTRPIIEKVVTRKADSKKVVLHGI